MLEIKTFEKFIRQANVTHQQFCVWFEFNNNFAKHQDRWNNTGTQKDARYGNFWAVTLPSTQHGWILGVARLFDPAFHHNDKKQERPRISFDYILKMLEDEYLSSKLSDELSKHKNFINSVRKQRNNVLAHTDVNFKNNKIEAGVENLFEWLETVITRIKKKYPRFQNCGVINIKRNEELSRNGTKEVFNTILKGEKCENEISKSHNYGPNTTRPLDH